MAHYALDELTTSLSPPRSRQGRGPTDRGWSISRLVLLITAESVLWLQVCLMAIAILLALAFGHRPVLIVGQSMEPNLSRGNVVALDDPPLGADLKGAIITANVAGRAVTHRVVGIDEMGNLVTRGDANGSTDSTPVTRQAIVGRARVVVPAIGLPQVWWKNQNWAPLAGWLLATMISVILVKRLGEEDHEDEAPEVVPRPANQLKATDPAPLDHRAAVARVIHAQLLACTERATTPHLALEPMGERASAIAELIHSDLLLKTVPHSPRARTSRTSYPTVTPAHVVCP